jgi:hypothetical protein
MILRVRFLNRFAAAEPMVGGSFGFSVVCTSSLRCRPTISPRRNTQPTVAQRTIPRNLRPALVLRLFQ